MKKAFVVGIFLFCLFSTCFHSGAKTGRERVIAPNNPRHQEISENRFLRIFKDYICQRLGKERSDIVISNFKVSGNKSIPAGKIRFDVFQKDKKRIGFSLNVKGKNE